MKKNLLPDMKKVKMTDPAGEEFTMELELRRQGEAMYVFVADTHQLGDSHLAQDAVFFFEKICQRFQLSPEKTVFFRHIFQEQMGSLFGRFHVDWQGKEGPSYKFHMLTNIEDLQSMTRMIETSEPVDLAERLSQHRSAHG